MIKLIASFIVLFALIMLFPNPCVAQNSANADFDKLVDESFDTFFQYHPTQGTGAGFHQYDNKLEDYSRAGVDAETAALTKLQSRLEGFDRSKLAEDDAADLQILQDTIRARFLELQDIQMWRKDADQYTTGATYAVFLIMKRNFAPQQDRLRSVIARERQIPKVFEAARKNLSNPPRVYTEVAVQQLPGVIGFFKEDVPKAFNEVKDPKLLRDFRKSNEAVIEALGKYQAFLQKTVLPASKGDFRIGAENYRKKLLYEEMVDVPLDRLLEIGYADLHKNQQRLKEVAAKIDPDHTAHEVLSELEKDHPPADQLLQTFRDVLGNIRNYIEEKKIITIPSTVLPLVEDTPPFARALTTASMDTPGAYETKADEAMFNVTTADPAWKPERIEEWMHGFNRGTIISTAIHEVYPGHYTQFLWQKQAPSKVRKILYCGTNAEGWAHYDEQMMLDEGYGNGDPKLRMGQLQDALLRDARFIAGIQMHTGKMTLEQANKFFVEQGYQTEPVADVESKRGTSDPTYLMYTLGKLQIMKLREDYRKQQGDKFTLQDFHDKFMLQGAVPLRIIRKAMLGNDSPSL
jgi:uncharacterized protein (DUF885 family)